MIFRKSKKSEADTETSLSQLSENQERVGVSCNVLFPETKEGQRVWQDGQIGDEKQEEALEQQPWILLVFDGGGLLLPS